MTRTEHLEWCKLRAREYLPADPAQAFSSMISDLGKHDDLSSHPGIQLGTGQMCLPGWIESADKVGAWIDGFN